MMKINRLEAISDGIFAVALTVLVLEIRIPQGLEWRSLNEVWPDFFAYVISFIIAGIYWNNHHHLLAAASRVTATVMWANMYLLFWLTLFPFGTGWMEHSRFAPAPTAVYGLILMMAGIGYLSLQRQILKQAGPESALKREFGRDFKGKAGILLYAIGVGLAFVKPWAACLCYVLVVAMWLIPDRRIERALGDG
jgi:uncharacterized membrane protein